ncbi:MAG: glycerophosphodiester phosphodiesterase family protein [Crocinitomicaceae bacterium]
MKYSLLFLLLLASACKKKADLPIWVLGHAGMGLEFSGSVHHANSKEAMTLALETPNLDGVEMDVRMASDGTLWLSHDEILDDETKSSGCVANQTEFDLQAVFYKTLKNEPLAKLENVNVFEKTNRFLLLDIKHTNFCENAVQDVNQFLTSLENWSATIDNATSKSKMILSNPAWIAPFLQKGWSVLFSCDDQEEIQQVLIDYPQLTGFVIKNSACTKNQVTALKSAGKEIYLYEVRSPKALKEVREKAPNGVMSDDVQGAIVEFK